MKHLIKALVVSSVIASTSAYAVSNVSLCYGAADIAVLSSRMHYANEALLAEGKAAKYSKELSQSKYFDFPAEYRSIYLEAVEYGFTNPNTNLQHVHEIAYSKCMHWMEMNNK